LAEAEPAQEARSQRPAIIPVDLGAGGFNQLAVLDARRAGGLAGAAIEAEVDVPDEGVGQPQPPFVNQDHLVDAAAGRITLQSELAVGGAVVQAKPAVDTGGVVFPARAFKAPVATLGWR
jgi:hypothetical protein